MGRIFVVIFVFWWVCVWFGLIFISFCVVWGIVGMWVDGLLGFLGWGLVFIFGFWVWLVWLGDGDWWWYWGFKIVVEWLWWVGGFLVLDFVG
ncbi:MAG: hypothetical protein U5N55_08190 [Cypionkella sp.]|nr:hypothetical protein [Cypionkella sp.]